MTDNNSPSSLIATHEVANCDSTEVVATRNHQWEPCIILRTTKSGFDVKIVSDLQVCKNVPKRFVRSLATIPKTTPTSKRKRKGSYGWSPSEMQMVSKAQSDRLKSLSEGKSASQVNAYIRNYLSERGITKRLVVILSVSVNLILDLIKFPH